MSATQSMQVMGWQVVRGRNRRLNRAIHRSRACLFTHGVGHHLVRIRPCSQAMVSVSFVVRICPSFPRPDSPTEPWTGEEMIGERLRGEGVQDGQLPSGCQYPGSFLKNDSGWGCAQTIPVRRQVVTGRSMSQVNGENHHRIFHSPRMDRDKALPVSACRWLRVIPVSSRDQHARPGKPSTPRHHSPGPGYGQVYCGSDLPAGRSVRWYNGRLPGWWIPQGPKVMHGYLLVPPVLPNILNRRCSYHNIVEPFGLCA